MLSSTILIKWITQSNKRPFTFIDRSQPFSFPSFAWLKSCPALRLFRTAISEAAPFETALLIHHLKSPAVIESMNLKFP